MQVKHRPTKMSDEDLMQQLLSEVKKNNANSDNSKTIRIGRDFVISVASAERKPDTRFDTIVKSFFKEYL